MKLEQSNKVVIKYLCSKIISLMVVAYNALQQQNYPMKLSQKLTKSALKQVE
jgi:hypothetical protein